MTYIEVCPHIVAVGYESSGRPEFGNVEEVISICRSFTEAINILIAVAIDEVTLVVCKTPIAFVHLDGRKFVGTVHGQREPWLNDPVPLIVDEAPPTINRRDRKPVAQLAEFIHFRKPRRNLQFPRPVDESREKWPLKHW